MNLNTFKSWAFVQGQVGKYDDGQFVGECVSLINQYCYRVLNVPAGAWGDAKDWATSPYVNQYFDHVSSPQAVDIGIMGADYGSGLGHIFIYLTPTTILEQNGREPLRVSIGEAYPSPIAILRKKGASMLDPVDQHLKELGLALQTLGPTWEAMGDTPSGVISVIQGLEQNKRAWLSAEPFKQKIVSDPAWQKSGGDLDKLNITLKEK